MFYNFQTTLKASCNTVDNIFIYFFLIQRKKKGFTAITSADGLIFSEKKKKKKKKKKIHNAISFGCEQHFKGKKCR